MSEPKRGMVAGQAITTQAQTKEFDEGYERIFGDRRKPCRGRFVWSDEAQAMVEVGADWEPTDAEKMPVFTDRYMENDRAVDGTDISNRTRRRNYMKARGLADANDFTQHIEKKEKERAAFLAGKDHDPTLHNTIGRALYEARKKGKRR